jgi:hypothetical protein
VNPAAVESSYRPPQGSGAYGLWQIQTGEPGLGTPAQRRRPNVTPGPGIAATTNVMIGAAVAATL